MITSTDPLSLDLALEAELSLRRLARRLDAFWKRLGVEETNILRVEFEERLQDYWLTLFQLLFELYGSRYDFIYHLECTLEILIEAWVSRDPSLQKVDRQRINQPDWFESERIVGGAVRRPV